MRGITFRNGGLVNVMLHISMHRNFTCVVVMRQAVAKVAPWGVHPEVGGVWPMRNEGHVPRGYGRGKEWFWARG